MNASQNKLLRELETAWKIADDKVRNSMDGNKRDFYKALGMRSGIGAAMLIAKYKYTEDTMKSMIQERLN